MDISKASNFERFVFDLTGRDAEATRALFEAVESDGGFDLTGTAVLEKLPDYGFISGRSTHADRLRTIRDVYQRTGRVIDTHTADGIKVAREHDLGAIPVICLETAQPAKFAEAIEEAIGLTPPRPPAFEGIEGRPQRVEVIERDVSAVRAFIERFGS
jgi:threonine synthase